MQHYEKQLHACGFQRKGVERFFDGATGKMWDGPVFFCPTYYQRLKHFSRDKVFGRALGKVSHTRQPIGGRRMRADCVTAKWREVHNGSRGVRVAARTPLVSSDMYTADVCEKLWSSWHKERLAMHCTAQHAISA